MITKRDTVPMHDLTLIQDFLHHLTVNGKAAGTIETYGYGLRGAARALPTGLCAYPDEILEWLAGYDNPSTRSTYASALGSFYVWAIRKGHITWNPMAELDAPRRPRRLPRPCTHDELKLILTQTREPARFWSLLAAYQGARCIEISRLSREDITETVTYLHGKGDKQRVVPTHPDVWEASRALPPGPVAGGRSAKSVSARLSAEYGRLGIRVTAHRLRHWCGTYALEASGGNLRAVQELLGHSSPAITQLYTAVSDAAIRSAVAGLPRVTGASGAAGA